MIHDTDEPQSAHELEGSDEIDRAVRRAIAVALTDKQREAVELFFFEGLSQSEIARRIGVSQQVVHKRLYGAVRRGVIVGGAIARLREMLAPLASGRAPRAASS